MSNILNNKPKHLYNSHSPQQIFDCILHWANTSITTEHLTVCLLIAEDHFLIRQQHQILYNNLAFAIDLKRIQITDFNA